MAETDIKDEVGEKFSAMFIHDGDVMSTFGNTLETARRCNESIPDTNIKTDDVLLCTPIKSGTHWTFEIIYQLLHGKAETSPCQKIATMLEAAPPEVIELSPSPRVLNTHLPYRRLPKKAQNGTCKLVLVMRNPKDVFLSMYKHHVGGKYFDYAWKWENYFPTILHGKLEYGSWFDVVREWEKQVEEQSDRILLVYYEDMKKDPVSEITKIGNHIGAKFDDNLVQQIADKTTFEEMKVDKKYDGEVADKFFHPGFNIFRKGVVGDWQTTYTPEQNEQFQKVFDEKMKGSKLRFRFE